MGQHYRHPLRERLSQLQQLRVQQLRRRRHLQRALRQQQKLRELLRQQQLREQQRQQQLRALL